MKTMILLILSLLAFDASAARYKCEFGSYVGYRDVPCSATERQTIVEEPSAVHPDLARIKEENEKYMEAKRKEWQEKREKCQHSKGLIAKYPDNQYIVRDAVADMNRYCRE